jgi:hypothetical protein
MRVKIISCFFTTSYGAYTDGLRQGLERRLGQEVGIIASNCGCGDPMERNRCFQDRRCELVEMPNIPYWTMSTKAKQWVIDTARQVLYRERARRYLKRGGAADVLHFQQTLNAFGSVAVYNWLALPCPDAARIVTVHELDPLSNSARSAAIAHSSGREPSSTCASLASRRKRGSSLRVKA